MPISTEDILTLPSAFGLTTATPCQRALCRALDGLPLGGLANDPDVLEGFGGAVDGLPTKEPPFEAFVIAAIRSAKTLIAAARALTISQTVDVSGLGRGDIVRILVAALKLDGTRPFMSHLVENMKARPLLRPLLLEEPTLGRVLLKHPSGRPIEVLAVPIDRAGGSALSVFDAGVIVDEAPRMLGEEDGVKNWDHFRGAVLGRILPQGQFISIGSPWAPWGPIYQVVQDRFGKPSSDVVVFRARGKPMNPFWWTPERMADLQRRNPKVFMSDCMAEFTLAETGACEPEWVDLSMANPPEGMFFCQPIAAIDANKGGSDRFTIAILGMAFPPEPSPVLYEDPETGERSPVQTRKFYRQARNAEGAPILNPDYGTSKPVLYVHALDVLNEGRGAAQGERIIGRITELCRRFGVQEVWGDQAEVLFLSSSLAEKGLHFNVAQWGPKNRTPAFELLLRRMRDGTLSLPRRPELRDEFLRIKMRPLQNGGTEYVLPRTAAGHSDSVAALVTGAMAEILGALPNSSMVKRKASPPPTTSSAYDG